MDMKNQMDIKNFKPMTNGGKMKRKNIYLCTGKCKIVLSASLSNSTKTLIAFTPFTCTTTEPSTKINQNSLTYLKDTVSRPYSETNP